MPKRSQFFLNQEDSKSDNSEQMYEVSEDEEGITFTSQALLKMETFSKEAFKTKIDRRECRWEKSP